MKMYKFRQIVSSKSADRRQETWGITMPAELVHFFKDVYFTFERSGTSIVLTSGAPINITKKEVEDYDLSDCRI